MAKHGVEHYITTVGPPVYAGARCLDSAKLTIAREEFATMERLGIVRRSNSPWTSPLHMVTKADGGWRPCGDFRRLNYATTHDRYPVPHIQDFSAHLAGPTFFSKVDLVRGCHQVPVHPQDVPKTAVIMPFGLFEFLRMPFGLKGAAKTFQRLMDSVLRDMPFLFVYLDDILVASATADDHLTHLRHLRQPHAKSMRSVNGGLQWARGVRACSHYLRPSTDHIDFAWGTREIHCGSVRHLGFVACVKKLRKTFQAAADPSANQIAVMQIHSPRFLDPFCNNKQEKAVKICHLS